MRRVRFFSVLCLFVMLGVPGLLVQVQAKSEVWYKSHLRMARGDSAKKVPLLEQAIKEFPRHKEFHALLIRAYSLTQGFKKGVPFAERVRRRWPRDRQVRLATAYIFVNYSGFTRKQDPRLSKRFMDKAIKLWPENVGLVLGPSWTHMRRGLRAGDRALIKQAIAELRHAFKVLPHDKVVGWGYFIGLTHQGLKGTRHKFPELALDLVDLLVKHKAALSDGTKVFAIQILKANGRHKDAALVARADWGKGFVAMYNKPHTKKFFVSRWEFLRHKMEYAEGVELLKAARIQYPRHLPFLVEAVKAHARSRKYISGLPLARRALRKAPRDPKLRKYVAELYLAYGESMFFKDPEIHLSYLKKAVAFAPSKRGFEYQLNYIMALFRVGLRYPNEARLKKSIGEFKRFRLPGKNVQWQDPHLLRNYIRHVLQETRWSFPELAVEFAGVLVAKNAPLNSLARRYVYKILAAGMSSRERLALLKRLKKGKGNFSRAKLNLAHLELLVERTRFRQALKFQANNELPRQEAALVLGHVFRGVGDELFYAGKYEEARKYYLKIPVQKKVRATGLVRKEALNFIKHRDLIERTRPVYTHKLLAIFVRGAKAGKGSRGGAVDRKVPAWELKRREMLLKNFRRWLRTDSRGKLDLEFKMVHLVFARNELHKSLHEPLNFPFRLVAKQKVREVFFKHKNVDTFSMFITNMDMRKSHAHVFPFVLAKDAPGGTVLRTWVGVEFQPHEFNSPYILRHEFAHLLEYYGGFEFLHKAKFLSSAPAGFRRNLPGWDGKYPNVFEYVMRKKFKGRYGKIGMRKKYPCNLSDSDFRKFKRRKVNYDAVARRRPVSN